MQRFVVGLWTRVIDSGSQFVSRPRRLVHRIGDDCAPYTQGKAKLIPRPRDQPEQQANASAAAQRLCRYKPTIFLETRRRYASRLGPDRKAVGDGHPLAEQWKLGAVSMRPLMLVAAAFMLSIAQQRKRVSMALKDFGFILN